MGAAATAGFAVFTITMCWPVPDKHLLLVCVGFLLWGDSFGFPLLFSDFSYLDRRIINDLVI